MDDLITWLHRPDVVFAMSVAAIALSLLAVALDVARRWRRHG